MVKTNMALKYRRADFYSVEDIAQILSKNVIVRMYWFIWPMEKKIGMSSFAL